MYSWFPVSRNEYLQHVEHYPLAEDWREIRKNGTYWLKQRMKQELNEQNMEDYFTHLHYVYAVPHQELRDRLKKEVKAALDEQIVNDTWTDMVYDLTRTREDIPPRKRYTISKDRLRERQALSREATERKRANGQVVRKSH